MLKKTYNKQTRIRKIITGMTGILLLFYLVSCGSEGDTSSPSPNNADSTPPSAVRNLKVDFFTDTQAVLSWTAPTNTGTTDGIIAATLSGYVVKYKKTVDSKFTEIDETGGGVRLAIALTSTSTNATVIGLSEGTSYTFLVVAVNSANAVGLDKDALTIEKTTLKPTPPSAVRNLKVDSFTDNQVVISWTAPTNTGTTDGIIAATLSGYVVKYKKTVDSKFTEIDETGGGVRLATALTGTSINATVIGLSEGTSYTFLVVAVNSANAVGLDKDALTIEKTTLKPTPPSAVENLKVDSFTDNQVVISWTTPTNTGTTDGIIAATLSGYVVKYKKTADSKFTEIDETGGGVRLAIALTGTSTTATVTGLDGNTSYAFLVVAVHSGNVVGLDEDAPKIEQTTIPAPPGKFRLAQCSKATSLDLTWDTSTGATSYKLYRDEAEIASITTNFYPDTGLTAGTDYTYKVQSCTTAGCSGDSVLLTISTIDDQDKNLRNLIKSGRTPADLIGYDEMSREIFSHYSSDIPLVAKYLKPGGSGGGSSFADAAGNLKTVLEEITSAADKVHVIFLAGGTYTPETMAMKNHVAIVGGVDECLGPSETVTALDGEGTRQLFFNPIYSVTNTALLYGVTIADGKADEGGGMHNERSSPSLVRVTFSGNTATDKGGGIYNSFSSPSLVRVTFSGNTATDKGGGIYNSFSSPSLEGVTFSGNSAKSGGGGMYNYSSSPSLVGVTFSGNKATAEGGGMYNYNSSPSLVGVTFSGNTVYNRGGGMYNSSSSPILVGVTFFGNTVLNSPSLGEGMYNNNNGAIPLIINSIFWSNTATFGSQLYFYNQGTVQETLRIYNSIVEGGTGTLMSGTTNTNVNQGGFGSGELDGRPGTAPIVISFSNIIDEDPGLGELADNGGYVPTHAIPLDSSARDQGLYVKKSGDTFYYSENGNDWHIEPDLSGEAATLPSDAVDINATDATGYIRTDRPDLGAYEAR